MTLLTNEQAIERLRVYLKLHYGGVMSYCRETGYSESFMRRILAGEAFMPVNIARMIGLERRRRIVYEFSPIVTHKVFSDAKEEGGDP